MATVLVTGATGFLGSHLVRTLLDAGYSVKALRRANSSLARVAEIADRIDWYTIDESRECSFVDFFLDVDCVIHTAANYGRSGERVAEICLTNTIFSLNVLNAAVEQKVKFFINTDSALPRNVNPYTLSKAQFAEWGRMFAENSKIRFVNIRLEHVYGPGDDPIKFTSQVIGSCLRNVDKLDLTEGHQQRDFIYIDDVVSAYMLLIELQPVLELPHYEIALGSGETVAIRDLVEMIHRIAKSDTELAFGAVAFGKKEVMYSCADNTFMKNLGWQPKTPLERGLIKSIEYERCMLDEAQCGQTHRA